MIQENPVIANKSQFVRFKKELTGDNLFARSAFEAKIGVGVESAQCEIRGYFDAVLVSLA